SASAAPAPAEPLALADVLRCAAAGVEAAGVTPARILVAHGRAAGDAALLEQAKRHLETAWQVAEGHGLGWLRLRVLILRALLADALGDREAALRSLAAAVTPGAPGGVVRPCLGQGETRAPPPAPPGAGPRAWGGPRHRP